MHESPPPRADQANRSVRRWNKLGGQMFFGLVALATVTALLAGTILRNAETSYLVEHAQRNNAAKFDLLRAALVENVVSEDLPQLETTIRRLIRQDGDLRSIEVLNETGKQLFQWQTASQPRPPPLLIRLFSNPHPPERLSGKIAFYGEDFGRVTAVWDSSRMHSDANRHGTILAVAAFAVCLLLGLLAFLVMHWAAINPINHIVQRIQAFRREVYDHPFALPRFASFELRRLEGSVDALGQFLIEREQQERELKAAKEAAESANRAKSTFLATMSHELRTPLNSINGFAEILCAELHGPIGSASYKDYAAEIQTAGNQLLLLINGILDISRIEADRIELQLEETELGGLLALAVKAARHPLKADGKTVAVEVAADLPTLRADERRLQQAFTNLISNALKFTAESGRIDVAASWLPATGVIVTVKDDGIGIAAEDIERITEPFVQIEDVLTRTDEGAGLGLPLAKAFVALHGGSMTIESEAAAGTVVTVILPPDLARISHKHRGLRRVQATAPLGAVRKA